MAQTTNGLSWVPETRMLNLCEVPRSTFRSWVKAGLVAQSKDGAYDESDVLEVALIAQIRRVLSIEDASSAWADLNPQAVEGLLARARELKSDDRCDLIIEPNHARVTWAATDGQLVAAVRHPLKPRPVVVLDVTEALIHIRDSYRRVAFNRERPAKRAPGRPAASVHTLRPVNDA